MKTCFTILTIFALNLSCGPASSDYAEVTLLTPFGMNKKFHSLSKNFFSGPTGESLNFFSATTCLQQNIFVGNNEQEGSHQLITKPLKLLTTRLATAGLANIRTQLLNSTLVEPITLSVLKGTPIDIGIMGAFYEAPGPTPTDDYCATNNGSFAYYSVGLVGHVVTTVNQNTTIPMHIWDVPANDGIAHATPVPATTPTATQFSCLDSPTNQNCAGKEFVKITSSNTSEISVTKVTYFHGTNGNKVTHELAINAPPSFFIVPHFFPMTVTYYDVDIATSVTVTLNTPSSISDANTEATITFTNF